MDASILLIGGEKFRYSLLCWVQEVSALTTESAVNEAMPLILAHQPDLLLIQASQVEGLELCRQVKAQSRLAWVYCLLVNDQAEPSRAVEEINAEVEALAAGADAYVCFFKDQSGKLPQLTQTLQLSQRLFQAHIQAGLRRIQIHRDLMRTNDVLSAIALSDPLTSLSNRRAFEWELPRQIQNARSRNIPISLIMLDVDFFKSINDTYGHLAGDQALKFLAARLRHNLRIYDTPFRYGGEEFVVLLSNTDASEALTIANRICQLISEQPFAIDETLDLTITISAGTSTLTPDDDAKGISLLQRADQYLLQAKAQGRNQVVGLG